MNSISLVWSVFKAFVGTHGASIQYVEEYDKYHLYAFNFPLVTSCIVMKDGGADAIDFETNYKTPGNATIRLSINLKDGANSITSTTVNAKRGIDANIINSSVPVTGTLTVGTLSSIAGRTYVTANLESVNSTTNIRTVTANKTFYLTGYTISCANTSLAAIGRISIRDSATNKIPFIIPQSVLGLVSPGLTQSTAMEFNPMPFTTNVTLAVLQGAITASISIYGYEE